MLGCILRWRALQTLAGHDISPILLQHDTASNSTTTPRPADKPLLNEWRFAVAGPCVNGAPRLAIRDNDLKLLINPPDAESGIARAPELYYLPPIDNPALLASPPEFQNLATDPKYASDVQRLTDLLMEWYAKLPAGPASEARGCAGYRWPGSAQGPDAGRGADPETDDDAWWG